MTAKRKMDRILDRAFPLEANLSIPMQESLEAAVVHFRRDVDVRPPERVGAYIKEYVRYEIACGATTGLAANYWKPVTCKACRRVKRNRFL